MVFLFFLNFSSAAVLEALFECRWIWVGVICTALSPTFSKFTSPHEKLVYEWSRGDNAWILNTLLRHAVCLTTWCLPAPLQSLPPSLPPSVRQLDKSYKVWTTSNRFCEMTPPNRRHAPWDSSPILPSSANLYLGNMLVEVLRLGLVRDLCTRF